MKDQRAADWSWLEASLKPRSRRLSGHCVEDALDSEAVVATSIAQAPLRLRRDLTLDCDAAGAAPRPIRSRRSHPAVLRSNVVSPASLSLQRLRLGCADGLWPP